MAVANAQLVVKINDKIVAQPLSQRIKKTLELVLENETVYCISTRSGLQGKTQGETLYL
jgi:hypothetical protein